GAGLRSDHPALGDHGRLAPGHLRAGRPAARANRDHPGSRRLRRRLRRRRDPGPARRFRPEPGAGGDGPGGRALAHLPVRHAAAGLAGHPGRGAPGLHPVAGRRRDHLLHGRTRGDDPAPLHFLFGAAGRFAGDQRPVDADPADHRRRPDPGGSRAPVGVGCCGARGWSRRPRGTREPGEDGRRRAVRSSLLSRAAVLPVAVVLLAALTLAACGGGARPATDGAGGDAVLNVFNWSEYMPDSVLAKFEEEFGVRVNYDVYSSNEELLAKLQAGGQGLYDVAVPSDFTVATMIELGLLEP